MGAGGQAIIQVLFGLNIRDSKHLISEDVKALNEQLKSSTIKVKLPVIVDPASLKAAVKTINDEIKSIKLDGLDLSQAVKDAKVEVGINDASLEKLGTRMDALKQSIDALNQTINGKFGSIKNISTNGTPKGPAGGAPGGAGIKPVTRAGMSRQGVGRYGNTGRYYIGSEKPKRIMKPEEVISGNDLIQGGIFDRELSQQLKDEIKFKLSKDTGKLSTEAAEEIKARIPNLAKSVFDEIADQVTNKGQNSNRIDYPEDFDKFFNDIAQRYFDRVESYIAKSDIGTVKTSKYDWDFNKVINSDIYKKLQEDPRNKNKPNSQLYRDATKLLETWLGKDTSIQPLTTQLIDQLDMSEVRAEEVADKAEKIVEQHNEDLKEVAKKLGVPEKQVTPLGQQTQHLDKKRQRLLDQGVKTGRISEEDAVDAAKIIRQQNAIDKMAKENVKSRKKTLELTEKIGSAEDEYRNSQVANEGKTKRERAKQDKEYNKAREQFHKKHVAQTEEETKALEEQIEKQKELNEEHAKATVRGQNNTFNVESGNAAPEHKPVEEAPKNVAKLTGSAAQVAKLSSLFERIGSARTRGDLDDAEKTYKEINNLIDEIGPKALKTYRNGMDWSEAHEKAIASGAKGSEIQKATADITRQAIKGYVNNIVKTDKDGNVLGFNLTKNTRRENAIRGFDSKYGSIMTKTEQALMKDLLNASKGNGWDSNRQSQLDGLIGTLKQRAAVIEAEEQRALDAKIRESNELIDIARDTSLSLKEQLEKGLTATTGKSTASQSTINQVAKAMGLTVSSDGTVLPVYNRDSYLDEAYKRQAYWKGRAYPSLSNSYGLDPYTSGNTVYGRYNRITDSNNAPLIGLKNRISRTRYGEPGLGGSDLDKEIEEAINDLARVFRDGSERWRMINEEIFNSMRGTKRYIEEYNKLVQNSGKELSSLTEEEKAAFTKQTDELIKNRLSNSPTYLWGAMRTGGMGDSEARIIREILEGRMLGNIDKDTAIRMFDSQETKAGIEMIEQAKKLLTEVSHTEENISAIRDEGLKTLSEQLPEINEIIKLAKQYGVEWSLIVDIIKDADGQYQGLATHVKMLTSGLMEDQKLALQQGVDSAKSSVNVSYNENPARAAGTTRIETSSTESAYKAIEAAARKAAQAQEEFSKTSDDVERETRETQEETKKQSSQWDIYHEKLIKIQEDYQALLALAPNLQKNLDALSKKNDKGTLKAEEIDTLKETLKSYNDLGVNAQLFSSNFKPQFESIIKVLKDAGVETEAFKSELDALEGEMSIPGAKIGYDRLAEFYNRLKATKDEVKLISEEAFKSLKTKQIGTSFDTLGQKITVFGEKYKTVLRMNPELNNAFEELRTNFNNVNTPIGRSQKNLNQLTQTLAALRQQAYESLTPLQRFANKIKNVFGERLMFMASTMLVSQIFGQFRNLYTAVSDVDKAMTELKKVTDLTSDSYDAFLKRATSQAKELGATVSDYVDATADFARLGYNMSDAENLAKTATVYKNVGDGISDIGTASESIISTMKAFGIEAKNSMDIVDAFNEVGNNFAISSTGIGEALSRSASALATANNDLDESIALIVAGNAVVQNPDTVGTALKTLSMRIRGAKTELEEAGESTEGMASSVSKLREQVKLLTAGKVDIMLDDKNFKSTYDILGEISKVWNNINDIDQANLLELLGGKRNANVLSSILTNFEDAEAVIKTIAGDTGSAMKEQEKWLDSIEGKTQQLKASAQGLAVDLIDTDSVKFALSVITKLIDGLDSLAKNKGIALGLAGIVGAHHIFVNLESTTIALSNGWKMLSSVAKGLSEAFPVVSSWAKKIGNNFKEVSAKTEEAATQTYTYIGAQEAETTSTYASSSATETDTAKKESNAVATNAAAAASKTLAITLGTLTAVLSAGMLIWGIWNSSVQKHRQAAEDAARNYEETAKSIEDYTEKIKEARHELDTSDSQATRLEKTEELRDIEEQLVDSYGKQASGIDLVNGKLDEELNKLKSINSENAKDVWAKYNDKRTGFGRSEADEAVSAFNGSSLSGIVVKGDDKDKIKQQYEEIQKYVESIRGTFYGNSFGSNKNLFIGGDLNEQKRVLDELYDYAEKNQDIFDERTRQSILQAYNDAVATFNKYNNTVQNVGASYFLKQDADSKELESYLEYLKQIEDYKSAIKSENFDAAAGLMDDMQKWLEEINEFPPIVQQYLRDLFADAIPVDMQVKLRLILAGIMDDKELQTALNNYKNQFGQIDIKLINADKGSNDYKKLTKSAQQYKSSIEEIVDTCNEYNKIELDDKFESKRDNAGDIADQIDRILEAEAAFDKLQKIYNDIKDGGQFDYGALRSKDFVEGFKDVEGAYNEFLETVTKYPNNLAKCQEAFNNLTTEYIAQKGILDNLSEANKDVTIAYLKNIGVSNAAEVVNSRLRASVELTESEYQSLRGTVGEVIKASKNAEGQYVVEASALADLGVSANDTQKIMAAAQAGITAVTKEQVLKRLEMYEKEASALEQMYQMIQLKSWAANAKVTGPTYDSNGKMTSWGTSQHDIDRANDYAAAQIKQYEKATGFTAEDAEKYHEYAQNLKNLRAQIEDVSATYTPPKTGKSKSGSGGSGDKYLENWKEEVKVKKELLEQDQITEQQYYDWLRDAYKKQGGPGWSGLSAEQQKKYRDEVAAIESELYKWEKDQIQKSIDEQDAILKNKYANGLISEAEYQKQLAKVTEEGYNELRRKVEEEDLFGVDTTERLNAETELLDKIKSAHNAAYDAEIKDLEHLRAMNLITDEQYYAQHAALVAKYYADEKMYAEELKEEEEKLYKERIDLVKKYSTAAKDAISSIMNIGKSLADAVNDLVTGLIDANSSNFDLQKNLLSHALKMNYITEEEYYKKLEDLYTTYYKSKEIYLDEYWENQEEIHEHEMDMLDKGASAMESIHAKVVDLIKSELEDAKDAIDETKDKYLDLIDIRKKALEKEKDENDYEKGRVEKLNSIAELQRQVNALANDTTAKGMAAYQKAYAELLKKQRELKEYDEDRAYDVAMDQLDAEADAYEKSAKKQTDAIDKRAEDNEWLVNEAWTRLQGMNEELYNQLIDYTHKHSTEIKDSVTGEWEVAKSAFEDYINNVKEGYYSVEDILAHPENYYMGNPLDAYNAKADMTYGEMRDAERAQDSSITKKKEIQNYAKVMGEFVESLADIMGDSFQSVAGILNTLFPSPVTDLLVDGADGLASALGMVGINNSLLSTAMAVGGITGIVESLGGLQTLAEGGTELGGVAIGGENVEQLLSLVQAIGTYQQGIGTTNELLQLLLGATAAGPTDGSSVVNGIAMIGAVMTALLGVGTLLAGGGGAGATTLFSLLGGFTGLLTNGSLADMQTATSLSGIGNLVLNIANYALRLIGSTDATTNEIGGLKAFLLNSWRTVHGIIQGILGGGFSLFNNDDGTSVSSTAEVLNGLTGTLGVIGSAIGTAIENNNPYQAVSFDNLPTGTSSSFAKMLGTSMDLAGTVMSAVGEIGAKVLPNIVSSRTGDVTVSPIFNIESHDPDGVANAVLQLMPRIADYTISTMMDSASNRGVKRGASALI